VQDEARDYFHHIARTLFALGRNSDSLDVISPTAAAAFTRNEDDEDGALPPPSLPSIQQ
jgi:hypothetical protein